MLRREFKINLRSLLIWTFILVIIYSLVFLLYPHIMVENSKSIEELLSIFPKDVLKAFNMDIADISTALGWFKTEGNIFLLLIYGLYASILGSNILLKEENDKTIEFLYSKPVSRNKILLSKIFVGIINILIMAIIVMITSLIGLKLCDSYDFKIIVMLTITPVLPAIILFLFSLFISTYFTKTKQTIGSAISLVFLNYFIWTFANISSKIEFIKYFSLYTLVDIRNIIEKTSFNIINIFVFLIISIILILLSIYKYNKKELV